MTENPESAGERTRATLQVVADEHRALEEWRPKQASVRDKLIQALKDAAAAVRDWKALDRAVEQEVSDQEHWVEWWDEHVSVRHGSGQGSAGLKNADRRSLISVEVAEEIGGIPQQKTSKWRKALRGDRADYRERLRDPSYRKAMGLRGSSDQRGASGSGDDEWRTPPKYIEQVRAVLGTFIDPASSVAAQEIVRAEKFYTKQDNGLAHEWRGNVFLNPPYSRPLITNFVSKLCEECRAGHVTAAILLTHNYTDTSWFHEIFGLADAICFMKGRVKFIKPGRKKPENPTQGQVFSYFGDDVGAFRSVFHDVGSFVVPWRIRDVG